MKKIPSPNFVEPYSYILEIFQMLLDKRLLRKLRQAAKLLETLYGLNRLVLRCDHKMHKLR